jgi:hypothetical protein
MYKFIAQLLISATIGAAVAAGSDANVRGYIGEALREPGAYIQESASAVANAAVDFSAQTDSDVRAENVHVNGQDSTIVESNEAAVVTENTVDVSAQSVNPSSQATTDVQVDSTVNLQQALPELLGLQADAGVDTQTQTDAAVETEDGELSLWEQLGLTLGFGITDEE